LISCTSKMYVPMMGNLGEGISQKRQALFELNARFK
jgi:hypothetical protein